jgi:putative peptidoglycan lipid II flippase
VLGVLVGAAGQLLLQAAGLRQLRYWPRLDLRQAEIRTILRLYGPVAAGLLVAFAGIALDRRFASELEAGSMTVMGYATRLIQFPLGLVGTAASLAVLPTLSKYATGMRVQGAGCRMQEAPGATTLSGEGDQGLTPAPRTLHPAPFPLHPSPYDENLAGYRDTLRFGLKLVLLLMVPAMLALVVLIEPAVRLLFEHRAFTAYDSARTSLVFLYYAPQLPLTAIDQVLIYAFYARRDTVTPVLVGVLTVGGYLVTALLTRDWLGVNGLALANTVQNGSHGLILLGLIGARVGGLAPRELLGFCGRVLLAALPMAAALWAVLALAGPVLGQTTLGLVALLGLELAVGLSVFGTLLLALRVPEARQVVELLLARWRRRG